MSPENLSGAGVAREPTEPGAMTDEAAAYQVGPKRPPLATRWQKGVSGNPHGRPRLSALGRRSFLSFPDMERALRRPVETAYETGFERVSLTEKLVNELTHMVTTRHNVAAARELLHWIGETERARAEREAEEAEAGEAERVAEQEAREAQEAEARHREAAARREAREAELRAQAAAQMDLEILAREGALDAGDEDLANDERALKLLDAAEFDGGAVTALKPWVVEAARAHSPDLPRGGDARPIDLADLGDALRRLEIGAEDEEGDDGLTDWFIDAARARTPERRFTPREEALLQRVRVEDADADWVERLAVVWGEAPIP